MINQLIFVLHSSIISGLVIFFGRMGSAALTSYISLLFVLTNIFVIKQMDLCGYHVTCADAYIIGISFGINVLQEIWGQKAARQAISISFLCSLFYVIMGLFHLWYIPAGHDTSHAHFVYLLDNSVRIIVASFISYLVVQYADTILYAFMKKRLDGRHFILRNYLSMFSSQFFDTILFSFLGLYGIVHNMTHIVIVSYGIKVVAILLSTPFLYYAKKYIKKS
ncbi:queuosine precursor transporter [Candidatus Chromulinivorax destructor]|uniref:Queuosine precursor transporter n=1 Tax=Candidatus Chromulinivorax destructor TaxID=2066483 RepID=A0A345ZAL9_9BACT|nr:queuosine precursor transporter [Candidatus Chromulinivorax destructor]AXK60336.1 hypothetical protein C0J27_01045 [Candidatus Chromulinivorax destructor]